MGKVVVGLSGGVDSAVAAMILKREGHEVIGVTMCNYMKEDSDGNSPFSDEITDASKIAEHLGIRHLVVDMREDFRREVIDYFVNEYMAGRTPNPCVMCNPLVKFESLYRVMESEGYDYIATGHYAQIIRLEDGRYSIKVNESGKDQTYALCRLTQNQLSHLLTPLAQLEKEEVRRLASECGLDVANKKDSQDICFVRKGKYFEFISEYLNHPVCDKEGDFVDEEGKVLGRHLGISHYTVGQRKKLGLALNKPVFVKEIRPLENEVVISTGGDVYFNELECDNVIWMACSDIDENVTLRAKIRYAHDGSDCKVIRMGQDRLRVIFDEPVRAVTPGQAIVFYKDDCVYLSGIIR